MAPTNTASTPPPNPPPAAPSPVTTPTPAAPCYRKVIHITALDSPNVAVAMAERGASPARDADGEVVGFSYSVPKPRRPAKARTILPGVLTWGQLLERLETWDAIRKTVGLWARFYEGAEVMLYPAAWLLRAEELAERLLTRRVPRRAKAVGIDPGEGGANTAWAAVDDYGLVELLSYPTPDTSVIPPQTIAFGKKHGVEPSFWVFDRGGGGYEHACTLRAMGHRAVRTVGFGEAVSVEPKRGMTQFDERLEVREEKYTYVNRRAQMYGLLHERLDPAYRPAPPTHSSPGSGGDPSSPRSRVVDLEGFAIPGPSAGAAYALLRDELKPIPLLYDREGRLKLLPKNKNNPDSDERTLTELIGHSPDEADALVLALYGMTYTVRQATASSF